MATLALAVAGAAVGGAALPGGVAVFGATLSGATIGAQVGALAGAYVDQTLLAPSNRRTLEGPRLSEIRIMASSEGAPIPRLYGRARLGGQVIWATSFDEEIVHSQSQSGSGKGGGGRGATTTTIEYRYYANFAVAIAEGTITGLGRVWADGRELDLSGVTYRLHTGADDQLPDALIEAREGTGNAPAYRGTAYIVFERLPLADFGNRLPQLSFEVFRAVDKFESMVRAVCMIPGAGEFVYSSQAVARRLGPAASVAENVHTRQGGTDWSVSLDQLETTLPNASWVSLIVGWFGDDLRAGLCTIRPGVDGADKDTTPLVWSVAGLARGAAHLISTTEDDRAAYGGTPSDSVVVSAIRDLKARGFNVALVPFVFMDVPADNTLPDPNGASSQPAYPWRGRIGVTPAAGQPGTADQTAAAATQISSFVGTASPADFAVLGDGVAYSGPAEWSYRRFILHYARLAQAAGGVDAFILGSEMRGLTQARDSASHYPFVDALVTLAADVKGMLGSGTAITYAADWSEYFGHQPPDGSGDVYFNLDPLWASPDVDAIGIDVYWPLSDWRDGHAHADRLAGALSIYDSAYLRANIAGGEGYDWYYASPADRDAQVRSPITDWLWRFKDIRGWWSNLHYNRPGGSMSGTPTAWVPQSKPFWFTELGCPAVDKGANQPNVFVDPKSTESELPYYSRATRDDYIQRCYLQAFHEGLDPTSPRYLPGANPVSTVYGGTMVDLDHLHVYAWDARPYPAFPADTDTWGDGPNWRLGHWINGRVGGAPLAAVVETVLTDYGFTDFDASTLHGMLQGFVIDRVLSAREALQPLELAFFLDSRESVGRIVFAHRGDQATVLSISDDGLVETRAGDPLATLTRGQETELPASAKITYISATGDYPSTVEEGRRLVGRSGRVAIADLPLVLDAEQAAEIAEVWLFETWSARERAAFALPPSRLALEAGDVVSLDANGRARLVRITEIGEHGTRDIEARGIDPDIYSGVIPVVRDASGSGSAVPIGQPLVAFLDLPLLRGDEPPQAGYVAAALQPWPGGVAFYRSPESSGYLLKALAQAPASIGVTLDPLPPGETARLDYATRIRVRLDQGALASVTPLALLAGANAAAIQNPDGDWEVVQFQSATLVAPAAYELSIFLRGQSGSEAAMRDPVPAGARFVLLDGAVARVDMAPDEVGLPYTWRCGPANRDLADASYVQLTHIFSGVGLKPLSPVHVTGARDGSGDIALSWIRRTRTGGDSWDGVEVPLGEDLERYEVDILDGPTVLRTLTTDTPGALYSAADQTADFGSPQSSLTVRVAQLSAVTGRGTPCTATV